MSDVIAVAFGYVLGSFLPAYFMGRRQGVDLRHVGTGNPGATNAYHTLGPVVGIIALSYDLTKGIAAMMVATWLRTPPLIVYASGLAAVAGHRFPFYLAFRGGQAVGASAGLLLFGLGVSLSRGWVSLAEIALLAVVALVTFGLYRRGPAVAVTVLPLLLGLVLLGGRDVTFEVFYTAVIANIWLVNVGIVRDEQIMVSGPRLSGVLRHAGHMARTTGRH